MGAHNGETQAITDLIDQGETEFMRAYAVLETLQVACQNETVVLPRAAMVEAIAAVLARLRTLRRIYGIVRQARDRPRLDLAGISPAGSA